MVVEVDIAQVMLDYAEDPNYDAFTKTKLILKAGVEHGSVEGLRGAIAWVRKCVEEKSISTFYLLYDDNDDRVIPAFISGLKTGSSEVKLDVMFILNMILEKEWWKSETCAEIGSKMTPILIPLLLTGDDNGPVPEQALNTLRWISEYSGNIRTFWSSDILPILAQVVAKTRNLEWLRSASHILMKISGADTYTDEFPPSGSIPELVGLASKLLRKTKDDKVATNISRFLNRLLRNDKGYAAILSSGMNPFEIKFPAPLDEKLQSSLLLFIGRVPYLAKSSLVPRSVRLLAKLVRKAKNDDVTNKVTEALTELLKKGDGFSALLSSGMLPSVIDLLAHPNEKFESSVFFFIAEVANQVGSSHIKICEFFEALKGSSGMKHYHKIDTFIKERRQRGRHYYKYQAGCLRFFYCIKNALESQLRLRMINAVMASGLDHALLQFLPRPKGRSESGCRDIALRILPWIARVLDEEVALKPLLDVLDWSCGVPSVYENAVWSIRFLIRYNPKVWDELIRLDGLERLIRQMNDYHLPRVAFAILGFLKEMLEAKPEGGLEPSRKVAECLNWVGKNVDKYRRPTPDEIPELLIAMLDCLDKVASYGKSGMELIRKNKWLKMVISALSENDAEVQKRALEILELVCGSEEGGCRKDAFKMGVLDCLPPLLQSPSVEVKNLAFVCLTVVAGGKLTSSWILKVLDMIELIRAEEVRIGEANPELPLFLSRIEELQRKQKKWWQKLVVKK